MRGVLWPYPPMLQCCNTHRMETRLNIQIKSYTLTLPWQEVLNLSRCEQGKEQSSPYVCKLQGMKVVLGLYTSWSFKSHPVLFMITRLI